MHIINYFPIAFFQKKGLHAVLIVSVLVGFNIVIWSDLTLNIHSATEAYLLWSDEGRHVRMLEHIQETGSWRLLQPSYTALHLNLSYLFSWIIHGGQTPIPAETFIQGIRFTSWLSMHAYLLTALGWAASVMPSFRWAFLAFFFIAFQRFSLIFATRLHPESTMILFVALTLWMAQLYLSKGKVRYLWAMAGFSAFAIGAKPQSIFLLPWDFLIFLIGLWKHRLLSFKRFFSWSASSLIVFAIAFLAASPYQAWNIKEWGLGLLAERVKADTIGQERSLWTWGEIYFSDANLGPIFGSLFFVGMGIGIFQTRKILRQNARTADHPLLLFFWINLSWIVVGTAYIVLTSHSFITRYLIHVNLSFVMIVLLGIYWGIQGFSGKAKIGVLLLLGVFIWGNLQMQWRRAMRDNRNRIQITENIPSQQRLFQKFQNLLPQDVQIIFGQQIYLDQKHFPQARRTNKKYNIGNPITPPWVATHKFEYLILEISPNVDPNQLLKKHNLQSLLKTAYHFPEDHMVIYQRL